MSQHLQLELPLVTAHSSYFFAVLDNQHRYVMANQRYSDISGLSGDQLTGKTDRDTLGEQAYRQLASFYEKALAGEEQEEELVISRGNIPVTLHFSIIPIRHHNEIQAIAFHAVDLSEKQAIQRSLSDVKQQFESLSELSPQGILLVQNDHILFANAAAARLTGARNASDMLGESLSQLVIDSQIQLPFNHTLTEISANTPLSVFTRLEEKTKLKLHLTAQEAQIMGQNAHIIMLNERLSETYLPGTGRENEHIDSFTGLYNRLGFTHHLNQLIDNKTPLNLLYLDIDNFKSINDSLGHHIGDRVIKEIASRLRSLLPIQAVLGHLGADEFGIILPEPEHERVADLLSERIISLINQPFDLHHFTKRLACSIGTVSYPSDAKDARVLLQNADTAMHEAKERGRNRYIKFNDQMNKEARVKLWLEIELQKALQQNGLEVWYQPKVNARNFNINGAEALVRWKHPIEGYISPGTFIHVAEKAGLIEHIGRVVMREVFNTVKRWKTQGILPGRVAINLSPVQFGNPKLINYMEKLLHTTSVDPNCITFELTESAVMSDSEHTLQMLNAIKKLGFALSIDDFGTGYSSLAYLARFPIDELKIDRAFINDIDTLPKQLTVIENIINLGRSLDLNVVAEGVETQQQASLLSNLNCHSIQGFHFYRPQCVFR